MGTNYYIMDANGQPSSHLGKRSAAGYYCFDCNMPLNERGTDGVHDGRSARLNACPMCGKTPVQETLEQSSGGLELGFNQKAFEVKTGVKSASSFTFAMSMDKIKDILSSRKYFIMCIIDEYGRRFTYPQFIKLLKACPIKFYHLIGKEFS